MVNKKCKRNSIIHDVLSFALNLWFVRPVFGHFPEQKTPCFNVNFFQFHAILRWRTSSICC